MIPPGTHELIATGEFSARTLVPWAQDALAGGFDSRSLRILAASDQTASPFEVEPLFLHSFSELGLEIPSREQALLARARRIASQIASGELEPKAGADLMHDLVVVPLEHRGSAQVWCDLSEGFDPNTRAPTSPEESREFILREARRWAQAS